MSTETIRFRYNHGSEMVFHLTSDGGHYRLGNFLIRNYPEFNPQDLFYTNLVSDSEEESKKIHLRDVNVFEKMGKTQWRKEHIQKTMDKWVDMIEFLRMQSNDKDETEKGIQLLKSVCAELTRRIICLEEYIDQTTQQ